MDETPTEENVLTEPDAPESDSELENAPDGESPADEPATPQEPNEGDDDATTPAPQTEAELNKQREQLARSSATWRRRVSDVLGEDAEHLVACPLCEPDIPGFMFPPELVTPWSDEHAQLLAVLRDGGETVYAEATDVHRCGACDGYGKNLTGSRVPGQETKACAQCSGFGYTPPPGASENGSGRAEVTQVPVFAGVNAPMMEEKDVWGSPRTLPDGQLNPNFGKMPQYKDATLP